MRSRSFALHVGLLLGGAALVLWGSSLAWISWVQRDAVSLGSVHRTVTGHALQQGMRAAALVALAAVPALFALRRPWLRRVLGGAVGVLAGVGALVAAVHAVSERRSPTIHRFVGDGGCLNATTGICFGEYDRPQVGLALVVLGSLLLLGAGAVAVVRGGSWRPAAASSYEVPGAAVPEPVTDKGVWDALDRGDDPTA
jgi:uncharacterized membrane protein (TIGR02234 family)